MDQTLTVWETQTARETVHFKEKNQYPAYCVTSVIIYSFIYWIRRTWMCSIHLCMLESAKVGSGRD